VPVIERERHGLSGRVGLRYVLSHPVLRNISVMMALINFVLATTWTELVLLAHDRLGASAREIGGLFAAGSAGVVVTRGVLQVLHGPR
jgi:hypothetical protein